MLQPLLLQLATILAAAYAVSVLGQTLRGGKGQLDQDIRSAPVFALAVLLLMSFPAFTPFGATVDARAAPAVLSGIFGGPVSAGVTMLAGVAVRGWIGGPYVQGGMASLVCYALLGLILRPVFARAMTDRHRIILLGLAAVASVVVVLPTFLIDATLEQSLRNLGFILPFLVAQNVVGILLLGLAIIRIVHVMQAGAEAALLRNALARATNGVMIIEGRDSQIVTYANAGAETMLGQSRDTLLGRAWYDTLWPEGRGRDAAPIHDAIARSVAAVAELRVESADGRRLISKATVSPVPDARQDGERFILILDDVTQERGQAHLLQVVTEHLPLMIAYFDRDLRCRHVNGTYTRFFGMEAGQIIGSALPDIVGPESFAVIEPSVRTVLGGQASERRIEMISPLTGQSRIMRESLFPQFADGSEIVDGYVVMVEDITERVQTEETLRRSEKLSAIGTLTGSIAHDYNNLSAVVIGNIEMAQTEPEDGRRAHFLRNALDASERAAALTKKLLSFARQAPLAPERLDVAAELQAQAQFLDMALQGRATLRISADADIPPVMLDRNGLLNALHNLVVNARDAGADGGVIELRASRLRVTSDTAPDDGAWSGDLEPLPPGDYACIEVLDQGDGVLPENRQRILDPFFTTKPFGLSAGLGLSITYGFVRQSGGRLRIADNAPRGTRVSICFPAIPVAPAPGPALQKPSLPAFAAEGRSILVVEDVPDVLTVLTHYLTSMGFDVHGHLTADGAAAALKDGLKPDFVMTDLALPGTMQGADLVALARNHLPKAGIVILSGYAPDQVTDVTRQDPQIALLQKPVTRAVLAATLARIAPAHGADHKTDQTAKEYPMP